MKNLRKLICVLLASAMMLSMAACGGEQTSTEANTTTPTETEAETEDTTSAETTETADDSDRPEGVSAEDWEAMKQEPAFGTELTYIYNGGNCVSAKYMADVLGYYEEYGINAKIVQGDSTYMAVGTGQAMWGIDHIATMLVPITNDVNYTFVAGAHVGCKTIFVLNDSDIQTVEDLKGKTVAIHDGLGNSDHNIVARLLDEYGVDPNNDIELLNVETSATIAAMENGEVDASIFSDIWAYDMVQDGTLRPIISLTTDPAFQDEPCCVMAMNNDFLEENPVHAKYITMAVKRAGMYNRLNAEDAVNFMIEDGKLSGTFEKNIECWDSLHFGLSDAFTERALREITEDYLRLGLITNTELTVDEIMEKAWTPVCPDEIIPDYSVGDPVEVEGCTVPIVQNAAAVTDTMLWGETRTQELAGTVADSASASSETASADSEHMNSFEASTSGQWDKMFVPLSIDGRAEEIGDLAPTAEEQAAMEAEPAYGEPILYYMSDGCTSGPTVADYLGYYEEAGLTAEGFKGSSYTEALGTNQAQVAVGHIATMLVPATNDVDLTFVGGAHIGCKSLYVLADSEYNTTEDLKGTSISVPNGIGASDYNITCLLLDADGINPQTDVNLMQVSTDACVASMENGEISAALLSDTFAYSLVQEGKLKCIRSLLDEDFADEPCCVIAMNATFVEENPTIAKKVVQCVQKAHQWMRENPEEASQVLIDEGMNSGDLEMNTMLNNSLQFGLDEDFTSTSLRTVVEKYIRLGLITATDDVDAVMEKVWTPVLDE